jgi:hypothetical protein
MALHLLCILLISVMPIVASTVLLPVCNKRYRCYTWQHAIYSGMLLLCYTQKRT